MSVISVRHLKKYYRVHEKEPGLKGSIRSLFTRKYTQVKAVDNIDFTIEEGELVGFIGPNGAGKTTTLKVLSGLLYPTSGEVSVLGFNPWDRKAQFQKQFALVMGQKNQLWWDLPPMETFILNKEIYEVPEDQFKKTLDKLIELLDVKDILKIQVRKLSLGQRMKCELIAALLHNPKVLFLDEPTIGLDVVMQKVMRDFVKQYNRQFKSTIILTSHYMGDVKELCERVIIIDKGKILFDGKLQNVIDRFARNKIITVVFSRDIDQRKLAEFGNIREYQFPRAKINVPRKDVAKLSAKLLSDFPVADLVIEEAPIEAIIREVFTGKMKQTNA
ncbi:MAG: ABC transporter [Candidatus Chisholmbacteria bacterium RIFCSPHIGHO2_01_FULL_49_18]|uniref:ABC transporter n=2 Tax=Candidatus Chisholmiibacteriota TaxID=1817900 RepID=A0A1G1VP30_9BACT|nr:MAG: ABC transporter [Candidatus Chisholmbacteria bacterium RIFCSPHIGHO2_01_FULL_49_18]OGY20847.1 MAG: ABC transporter [Candidatus Chisholmbacteria bacterium RIFCSPLOWO2_01_FULL_49_14]